MHPGGAIDPGTKRPLRRNDARPRSAMTLPILTTLHHPSRQRWSSRVESIDRESSSPAALIAETIRRGRNRPLVVLNGAERTDQIIATGLAARGRSAVLLSDCTWKRQAGPAEAAASRLAAIALGRGNTDFCVLSTHETESLPRIWGFDPERVHRTPFCFTLDHEDVTDPPAGAGVFAGGDSLRDWPTLAAALIEADAPARIASRDFPTSLLANLPAGSNPGALEPADFVASLRAAAVVVVALQPGIERSAGQQTYLNAMALGKLAIATDSPGVRDHIEHGVSGIIVAAGDPGALAAAIRNALDPDQADAIAAIRANGRRVALEHYSEDRYLDAILAVADRLIAKRTDGRVIQEKAARLSPGR